MEVHPPHHPLLSWRDFFIHIATITIGLLIAIALEQSVEALHHRHQRMEARENLRREITENRETFAGDIKALASEKRMLQDNITALRQLRARQSVAADSLHFAWRWNSMQDSAWRTAGESAELVLFPIEQLQAYSITYGSNPPSTTRGLPSPTPSMQPQSRSPFSPISTLSRRRRSRS